MRKKINSFGTEPDPKAFLPLDEEEAELMRMSEEPGRVTVPKDDPRHKMLRQAAINSYTERMLKKGNHATRHVTKINAKV